MAGMFRGSARSCPRARSFAGRTFTAWRTPSDLRLGHPELRRWRLFEPRRSLGGGLLGIRPPPARRRPGGRPARIRAARAVERRGEVDSSCCRSATPHHARAGSAPGRFVRVPTRSRRRHPRPCRPRRLCRPASSPRRWQSPDPPCGPAQRQNAIGAMKTVPRRRLAPILGISGVVPAAGVLGDAPTGQRANRRRPPATCVLTCRDAVRGQTVADGTERAPGRAFTPDAGDDVVRHRPGVRTWLALAAPCSAPERVQLGDGQARARGSSDPPTASSPFRSRERRAGRAS